MKELLLAILDSLHEDSNKVRKKPMVPPMEDAWVNNTPVPRVGREAWWRYVQITLHVNQFIHSLLLLTQFPIDFPLYKDT